MREPHNINANSDKGDHRLFPESAEVLTFTGGVGVFLRWDTATLICAAVIYCGKEFKRKLEHGPVDHDVEFKCRVYENGRVVGRSRDSAPIGQLFRASNQRSNRSTSRHDPANPSWERCKAFYLREVITLVRQNASPAIEIAQRTARYSSPGTRCSYCRC